MLDANDAETRFAIRQLEAQVAASTKPILLWVGAGASAWCDYPLWESLAERFDDTFAKFESTYSRLRAHHALTSKDYPAVFQLCQEANRARYHMLIAETFAAKPVTPLYRRFIGTLQSITPLHVVTTNVDEQLEQNLPGVITVQQSNLERCIDLLLRRQSFVCKLHGSVSRVESTIFTTSDYALLLNNSPYLTLLGHLFRECTVVFVGYGLGDAYVLSSLSENSSTRRVFGDGPHFVITSGVSTPLPTSMRCIRYRVDSALGHRGPLQVVEVIRNCRDWDIQQRPTMEAIRVRSAHFLSAIYPPGVTTGGTMTLGSASGMPDLDRAVKQIIHGDGLTSTELPTRSTLMHDLVVSLLCFDQLYLPVMSAAAAHDYLTAELFWELVQSDVLRLVRSDHDEGISYFAEGDIAGGGLSTFDIRSPSDQQITTIEMIRRQIHAAPGAESVANVLLESLAAKTEEVGTRQYASIVERTNGLLLLPQIRRMLGMSGGTPLDSLPRWLAFPILRLARIVRVGVIANMLNLCSVKLLYGARDLAATAFSAVVGDVWADQMASYVVTHRFDSDLGDIIFHDRSLLRSIVRFRQSQEGEGLRKEILQKIQESAGSDLISSIDGGLRSTIPLATLQQAHDQMSALLTAQGSGSSITPTAWSDMPKSGDPLERCRKVSAVQFKQHCANHGIGPYDLCPCGSGERRRFCCERALNDS